MNFITGYLLLLFNFLWKSKVFKKFFMCLNFEKIKIMHFDKKPWGYKKIEGILKIAEADTLNGFKARIDRYKSNS